MFQGNLSSGELNFIISTICKFYLQVKGKSYQYINEVMGVLDCAKIEYYRKIAAPYSDEKAKENGDIF